MHFPCLTCVTQAVASETLFKVQKIKGKGYGVVAAKHLTPGQQIISEQPLIDCPARLPLSSPSPKAATAFFEEKVTKLSSENQDLYYSLSDWRSEASGQRKDAYLVFLSNAMPKGRGKDATGAGVFATACRINHSCLPNCHFSWCSLQQKQAVHVVSRVAPGDELGATYTEPFAKRTKRIEHLQKKFGFLCSCPACNLQGNDLKESDDIRERLAAVDIEIKSQTSSEKAMQGLEEVQTLMQQEGFSNPYFVGRICQSVIEGRLLAHDLECCQRFAHLALQSFTTCEGEQGDSTMDIQNWMSENVVKC